MMSSINVAFANLNGLATKVDKIVKYIEEKDIGIFCMVETWLKVEGRAPIRQPFCNRDTPSSWHTFLAPGLSP